MAAAPTPRTLWVELTSKCPFDCVFCSRRTRRGAGEHLPFALYASLVDTLVHPRKFILNYSGESTVYPELVPAIEKARATGAAVELVSVLAAAPDSLLAPLSRSGLSRLTVSVHATDSERFAEIYRHGSFAALRARLARFLELCRDVPQPPYVDLAFVAMDANLAQLESVASLAGELDLHEITVFPVMRRDTIPAEFLSELTADGTHRPQFETRVRAEVDHAAQEHPDIRFHVCGTSSAAGERRLGDVPVPYPWPLPPDAFIHTCEQNPWETTHVLSNGDVVACEVLDKQPLGSLLSQSIEEIWRGDAYQRFRERYRQGEVPECRACPWKSAYRPHPYESEIIAARGLNCQLLYGWHTPEGEPHIWSSQQAAAVLAPRPGSRTLHVSGMLPPGSQGASNRLTIRLNGRDIGRVTNPWEDIMPFGLDFDVEAGQPAPWLIEFRSSEVYRPCERGGGADRRDLGFALVLVAAKEAVDVQQTARCKAELVPFARFVRTIDRWAVRMRGPCRPFLRARPADKRRPGFSILIPEWDNVEEFAACLKSAYEAALHCSEPWEIVAVVNGSPKYQYERLRRAYPDVRWTFYRRPLGFGGAIQAGLRSVQHDWVYLLNSDVELEPSALNALLKLRSPRTFSIGSQILLKDTTRFRDETNWTGLLLESGLATVHDWIPQSDNPAPSFYSGGGASLFRTSLLRRFVDASAYHPFYWEDVEWGWRSRKLGYESWFCPVSIAHHTRRSTIARHHPAEMIDEIIRRNALLFHLRNLTTAGPLECVMDAIAEAPETVQAHLLSRATRVKIARGRIWNYLSPLADEEVFERWNRSISPLLPGPRSSWSPTAGRPVVP